MEFEWDPGKRAANLLKHGLDFNMAAEVIKGPCYSRIDTRKNYGEVRYLCIGKLEGRHVVLVYTRRGNCYRIISMRKANERERKDYQKRLGTN